MMNLRSGKTASQKTDKNRRSKKGDEQENTKRRKTKSSGSVAESSHPSNASWDPNNAVAIVQKIVPCQVINGYTRDEILNMDTFDLIEKQPELASNSHEWDNVFNDETREDIIANRIYDWGRCWNCGFDEAKESKKRTLETMDALRWDGSPDARKVRR